MQNLTAIIVDDEEKAQKNLTVLLEAYCPDVQVVATCPNINAARIALLENHPDLVFLDIRMPGGTGFDLISGLEERTFEVIFTTAYDQYAIQAFENNAVGYLLKPIVSDQLIAHVERARSFLRSSPTSYDQLLTDLRTRHTAKKLALPIDGGYELIPPEDILWIQASGSYCMAYFTSGRKCLLVKNLKSMEQMLNGLGFFRIHHSHMVNLHHVNKVLKLDGGFVLLSDGTELEISRRKRNELLNHLLA